MASSPMAQAQFSFEGAEVAGTVSGGVDIDNDGVYDDGTWSLVHNTSPKIEAINFPAVGGVSMRYRPDVADGIIADFTVLLNDPDVTYDLAIYGNEGQNQTYEAAASSYELSWPVAGTAEVFDPIYDQINDAATIVTPNSITVFQNRPPAEIVAECAFRGRDDKDYLSECLEWYGRAFWNDIAEN